MVQIHPMGPVLSATPYGAYIGNTAPNVDIFIISRWANLVSHFVWGEADARSNRVRETKFLVKFAVRNSTVYSKWVDTMGDTRC